MRSIADWPKGMPPPSYTFPWAWDAGRYQPTYLRLARTEASVQLAILDFLNHRHVLAWATDSGAKTLRGRAVGALRRAGHKDPNAALVGRTGAAHAGHPDIIGLACWPKHPGRMVAIEVKKPAHIIAGRIASPPGLPTAAQLAFLDRVYRAGGVVGVAWSVDDAAIILGQLDVESEAF